MSQGSDLNYHFEGSSSRLNFEASQISSISILTSGAISSLFWIVSVC